MRKIFWNNSHILPDIGEKEAFVPSSINQKIKLAYKGLTELSSVNS